MHIDLHMTFVQPFGEVYQPPVADNHGEDTFDTFMALVPSKAFEPIVRDYVYVDGSTMPEDMVEGEAAILAHVATVQWLATVGECLHDQRGTVDLAQDTYFPICPTAAEYVWEMGQTLLDNVAVNEGSLERVWTTLAKVLHAEASRGEVIMPGGMRLGIQHGNPTVTG